MARPRTTEDHDRRTYSVLVDWGRSHRALGDFFELLEGLFTLAEAERLCRECRRLGAELASVDSRHAARKLFATDPRGAPLLNARREAEHAASRACEHTSTTNPEGGAQMPRVIEVIVAKDGGTSVQTKGYRGGACVEASKWIERALGVTAGDRKTAEFFETATAEQKVEQPG